MDWMDRKDRLREGTARFHRCRGSTLILALGTISVLAIMAAYTLQRVSPKFLMASQSAGWQEARLAAEGGVDIALNELQKNAVGSAPGTWSGWKQNSGGTLIPVQSPLLNSAPAAPASGSLLGSLLGTLLNPLLGSLLGGPISPAAGPGTNPVTGMPPLDPPGTQATQSAPIYLDNVTVSAGGARPANVNVQLWAVYPTSSPYYRWFRIRAMATCGLPKPCYQSPDDLDASLRRDSLRQIRPQLGKDNPNPSNTLPTPSASRVTEVLIEPVLPFEVAILTDQSLSLSTGGSWGVDSYDSRDPLKSNPDGTYPGKASPLTQSNGNIASNLGRPGTSLYGPLISANGCKVRGAVATNGGDDPNTPDHENISGAIGIDPTRVRSDFYREMPPFNRPASGIFLPAPGFGAPFTPGTEAQPTQYHVTKDLHDFSVSPPPGNEKGAIVIMVDGNLDVQTGTISIPLNVTAVVFVAGNVDFHGNGINNDASSSRRADRLQIYGEDSHGEHRTLRAFGAASICAAFYGPHYDVALQDNVEWFGAVAAKSFQMVGGGTGGFHYDEALGMIGAPVTFRIARYVEDVRE